MNADQEKFIAERHGFDIVLKARQKGFTTVIQLDMLDDCLFVPNTAAGVIAHNLRTRRRSSRTRSSSLTTSCPMSSGNMVSATSDTVRSLKFSNGSSIRVGTSLRSGTLQRLHVSEYGKLCAKFPEKAREVKSGAFNTVQAGQRITVESTAEGHAGHFYEMTKAAQDEQARATS
jgi:N-methylhydantoinase B/oxoprolinase/acetone carboxylase alpha subunit